MDSRIQIMCGDAAELLRSVPDGAVALTVTSPPYYRHRDYGVSGQIGREPTLALYLERITSVLAELFRVTDEAGTCFFVVGDSYVIAGCCWFRIASRLPRPKSAGRSAMT